MRRASVGFQSGALYHAAFPGAIGRRPRAITRFSLERAHARIPGGLAGARRNHELRLDIHVSAGCSNEKRFYASSNDSDASLQLSMIR